MTMHDATSDQDQLRFWVTPGNAPAYQVDLTEFAVGGRLEDVRSASRWAWSGDYTGRPRFALQIAAYHRLTAVGEQTSTATRAVLRTLFRFLDAAGLDVGGVEDLTDAHGQYFKAWLETERNDNRTYHSAKTVVDRMRQLEGLPALWWPARRVSDVAMSEDVDLLGMNRLFNALKGEARQVKAMFAEGERLAAVGSDPRGESFARGFAPANWEPRENHAWLVRQLSCNYLPEKREFLENGGQGLHKANYLSQFHLGPSYLAPGMTDRGREGIVGKLRWFHPSYHDTSVFLWLFMLGTGWNLSTALAIDVTSDALWFDDHPHKPEFKVMHAFKGRAGKHVFALSLGKPEWHPFQIVKFMIERTSALRETLRRRLVEMEAVDDGTRNHARGSEIEHLRGAIRSPWLYHVVNKIGQVGAFHNDDSAKLNSIVRIVAERNGLMEEHPSLAAMGTSIARDAWIGFAYAKSGHHVVLAQLAAQHANVATLKHYLSRRRYRAHSERMVRKVHDAVFAEIETKMAVDATRLRLLVQSGSITPDQERRLLDHRQRTRLGMGCLDPTHPPPEIAPGHPAGTVCSVQRCTGCHHGVVFSDSLEPLARARAELLHLHRTLPLTAWAGSSLEDEAASLDETLAQFDASEVETSVASWTSRIRNGEVAVHDTYPSY